MPWMVLGRLQVGLVVMMIRGKLERRGAMVMVRIIPLRIGRQRPTMREVRATPRPRMTWNRQMLLLLELRRIRVRMRERLKLGVVEGRRKRVAAVHALRALRMSKGGVCMSHSTWQR
jgi:hypothetical protein